MSIPPFDQYASAFTMIMGVMDRGLRQVAYEEERRSRDDVLIALAALRDRMASEGINIPAQAVLSVFEEQTRYEVGSASLVTLVKQASERKLVRMRTSAFDIMDSAMKHIETERKNNNGKPS